MRVSFVACLAALVTTGCSQAPYAVLPHTSAYHQSVTTQASAAAPAAATATPPSAPTATTATASPATTAATSSRTAAPLAPAAPKTRPAKRATLATAPLHKLLRQPLRARHHETAGLAQSSSLGSVLLVVVGAVLAVLGGSFLFLSIIFSGASAAFILVALLLFLGGLFLIVRGLRSE